MYYEVSIYYNAEVEADVFNIDKDELMSFINFLTTRINNLHSFTILLKYTYQ
jgi:hypothetical protein